MIIDNKMENKFANKYFNMLNLYLNGLLSRIDFIQFLAEYELVNYHLSMITSIYTDEIGNEDMDDTPSLDLSEIILSEDEARRIQDDQDDNVDLFKYSLPTIAQVMSQRREMSYPVTLPTISDIKNKLNICTKAFGINDVDPDLPELLESAMNNYLSMVIEDSIEITGKSGPLGVYICNASEDTLLLECDDLKISSLLHPFILSHHTQHYIVQDQLC